MAGCSAAGLAFQAVVPRASRFTVTLATGAVATVAGMFPAIAMKLLDFVALYGLVLMPMGAVVLGDYTHLSEGDWVRCTGRVLEVPVITVRYEELTAEPRRTLEPVLDAAGKPM